MNTKLIIGIVVAIILIGGVVIYSSSNEQSAVQDSATENTAMMQDEAMMENTEMNADAMAQQPGDYKDYSQATFNEEQQAGNKVVLFFHATWCPDCRTADTAFKANVEKIPTGVSLLKVDYDGNIDLRKKYAITTQHTFVQIDESENVITKWVSGDVDMLIKSIK